MELKFNTDKKIFFCISTYQEKDISKEAGFKWDAKGRQWWTDSPEIAQRLQSYADGGTTIMRWEKEKERESSVEKSKA